MDQKKIEIRLMPDDSEVIPYDTAGIPIYVRSGWLSMYANMRSLCHWHEDLEFVRIYDGYMHYWINGQRLLLKEGDCLMVNSRQMHYGYSHNYTDCNFTCIILHPDLLPLHPALRRQWIDPLLQNSAFEFLHLTAADPRTDAIRANLDQIRSCRNAQGAAAPLQIAGILSILLAKLNQFPELFSTVSLSKNHSDTWSRQNMIAYIYQHYSEKIGLDEIAKAGHVCRNKCCQIFRNQVSESPIDFLNHYRLEVSRGLLAHTDQSIAEIAQSCGFGHSSYYSKLFFRTYQCTPTTYRKSALAADT